MRLIPPHPTFFIANFKPAKEMKSTPQTMKEFFAPRYDVLKTTSKILSGNQNKRKVFRGLLVLVKDSNLMAHFMSHKLQT